MSSKEFHSGFPSCDLHRANANDLKVLCLISATVLCAESCLAVQISRANTEQTWLLVLTYIFKDPRSGLCGTNVHVCKQTHTNLSISLFVRVYKHSRTDDLDLGLWIRQRKKHQKQYMMHPHYRPPVIRICVFLHLMFNLNGRSASSLTFCPASRLSIWPLDDPCYGTQQLLMSVIDST